MRLRALIRERADSDAGAAIEFGETGMGWKAVESLCVDLAAQFEAIPPHAAIGVVTRNHPGAAAAVLAVISNDRCAVLINPLRPSAERFAEMAALGLYAVIAEEADWNEELIGFVTGRCTGIYVPADGSGCRVMIEPPASVNGRCVDASVAVEIQTSGTTGLPKRIPVNGQLLETNSIQGGASAWPPESKHSAGSFVFAPLGHASGLAHMLMSAYAGLPMVLFEKFRIDELVRALRRHRPSSISLAPAMIRMLMDSDVAAEDLSSLVSMRCGTAALDVDTQVKFEQRFGVPVLTNYGATEFLTAIAAWTVSNHKEFAERKRGSVGRIAPGVQVRIIDETSLQPVETGAIGLLEVRPAGVDRWVRTTDLASVDADDFVFLHGRADNAIVRGGFKILSQRVEDILRRHEGVGDVAVVPLDDRRLGQVPVAAVEPTRAGPRPTVEGMMAFARSNLLPFEVPARFLIVDALPRTPSQKVALPEITALFVATLWSGIT